MTSIESGTRAGSAADVPARKSGTVSGGPRPVFIVLEGLSGVGKSTVAPLVAKSLGAVLIDSIPPQAQQLRQFLDRQPSLMHGFTSG